MNSNSATDDIPENSSIRKRSPSGELVIDDSKRQKSQGGHEEVADDDAISSYVDERELEGTKAQDASIGRTDKNDMNAGVMDEQNVVDVEVPQDDDEHCSSALSSRCSSPAHDYSSYNEEHSGEKESNESESAASISSAASASSGVSSTSSYQCPPAPPTTPIQPKTVANSSAFHNVSTPKPSASGFPPLPTDEEMRRPPSQQQMGRESTASMPASEKSSPSKTKATNKTTAHSRFQKSSDFDTWKVGPRYELMRILGCGSYGQVAQAKDLQSPNGAKFVAIKRITTAFEQEVDALRFFRELHLLRRLKGHDCIIQLVDAIAPNFDKNKSLDDIYLVFECKCT